MKKFVRIISMLAPLALLISCERITFNNYLNVEKEITIKGKQNTSMHFEPGKIFLDLTINQNRKVEIKVFDKQKQAVVFKLPRENFIPMDHGDFFIKAEEMKQEFDLEGNVMTSFFDTPSVTTVEVCQRAIETQVCRSTSQGTECSIVTVYKPGKREVVTHYEERETTLDLTFKTPGASEIMATFKGTHVSHERQLVDIIGECTELR